HRRREGDARDRDAGRRRAARGDFERVEAEFLGARRGGGEVGGGGCEGEFHRRRVRWPRRKLGAGKSVVKPQARHFAGAAAAAFSVTCFFFKASSSAARFVFDGSMTATIRPSR